MKKKSASILLLAFGFLGMNVSGDVPDKSLKKSAKEPGIEGTWQLTRITAPTEGNPGFEEAPEGYAASLKISFQDGKMTFIPGEPGYTHYTFTTNSKMVPKQLTWKPAEAINKDGDTFFSIYKIEGDKITIMLGDGKRPVAFDRIKGGFYEGKRLVKVEAKTPQPKEVKP